MSGGFKRTMGVLSSILCDVSYCPIFGQKASKAQVLVLDVVTMEVGGHYQMYVDL